MSTRADWDYSMRSILYAAHEFSRLVIPYMQRQKWGRIIMTGSTSSRQPRPRRVVSNASKAALLNFTKSLAGEFVRDGILVNIVNPGRFNTHWPERIAKMAAESGRTEEEVYAEVTKDIAASAAWERLRSSRRRWPFSPASGRATSRARRSRSTGARCIRSEGLSGAHPLSRCRSWIRCGQSVGY